MNDDTLASHSFRLRIWCAENATCQGGRLVFTLWSGWSRLFSPKTKKTQDGGEGSMERQKAIHFLKLARRQWWCIHASFQIFQINTCNLAENVWLCGRRVFTNSGELYGHRVGDQWRLILSFGPFVCDASLSLHLILELYPQLVCRHRGFLSIQYVKHDASCHYMLNEKKH